MNPTQLNIGKDVSNSASYAIPFSNLIYNVTLLANTAQYLAIPGEVDTAIFSYGSGGDVFISFNGPAILPSDTFTPLPQELNPQARDLLNVPIIGGGRFLSAICPNDNYLTVAFYNRNGFSSL